MVGCNRGKLRKNNHVNSAIDVKVKKDIRNINNLKQSIYTENCLITFIEMTEYQWIQVLTKKEEKHNMKLTQNLKHINL